MHITSWLSPFVLSTVALPAPVARQAASTSRVVAQLASNNTFLENLAFRSNGDMLVTQNINSPGLYIVKQPWASDAELTLLHRFADADGALGTVQIAPDHFVVATSKWNGITPVAGSETLQYIKLHPDGSVADTGLVGRYPAAGLLNGAIPLGDCHGSILVADSVVGVVYKINPLSGAQQVAVDVPEMKASDPDAALQLGVNGIKMYAGHLYWSNSNTRKIHRVAINKKTGSSPDGAVVDTVASFPEIQIIDDFAIDPREGTIYVAAMFDNEILLVRPDGSVAVVLGNPGEFTVAGPTALAFGVTDSDRHILYATTNGAMVAPVNGTVIEPGKVVAIDIAKL
ncbi:SMP-30/gluconolactonase/LRE family protein [Microdochium nivale]|nr:SMP-30/gluconolactonase/LRE family protein [Microdochium nivale]